MAWRKLEDEFTWWTNKYNWRFLKGEIIHKFIAKIKSDCNEIKIVKIIRDFSHEPIGIIKEKMELGWRVQLFLDDEIVSMQFLSNVIESQEDTKNQIEQYDSYMFDEEDWNS